MNTFFSMLPPGVAAPAVQESLATSYTPDEGIFRGSNKRREGLSKYLHPLLFIVAVVAVLAAGAYGQRKWYFLDRVQEYLERPTEFPGMKNAAEAFRNELFYWRKAVLERIDLNEYVESADERSRTINENFYMDFRRYPIDLIDHEIREDVWRNHVEPYVRVADLELLEVAATEFLQFRDWVSGKGFNDEKTFDRTKWDEVYNIDAKAFGKWASDFKGDEASEKRVKFYAAHLSKFFKVKKDYMAQRKSAIKWLTKKHADVGKLHPDIKQTKEIDPKKSKKDKAEKEDEKKGKGEKPPKDRGMPLKPKDEVPEEPYWPYYEQQPYIPGMEPEFKSNKARLEWTKKENERERAHYEQEQENERQFYERQEIEKREWRQAHGIEEPSTMEYQSDGEY